MINATQIRKGMLIILDKQLYRIMEVSHITPGRLKAKVQTKLRNIEDMSQMEYRFRSEDRVEPAYLEEMEMEFLYRENEDYIFMNLENYEQIKLDRETIGDGVNYLTPNIVIKVERFEGRPVGVSLPNAVELEVVNTEPMLKGATQSAMYKPAEMETGITIQVPQFIKTGDRIRVDTRDGKYMERAKK